MRLSSLLIVWLFLSSQNAIAEEASMRVDGDAFTVKFVGKPPNGNKLVEYVRDSESFDRWTKLIGYRYEHRPELANDPIKYAHAIALSIKLANPKTNYQLLKNEKSAEAILDFLLVPSEKNDFFELNVFRYWRNKEGDAIYSVQLVQRFGIPNIAPGSDGRAEFISLGNVFRDRRSSLIKQVSEADKEKVESMLAVQQ